MEDYLHSRKSIIIRENYKTTDKISEYLKNQAPTVLQEEPTGLSAIMKAGQKEKYAKIETFNPDVVVPPLNTDIRFSNHLPTHIPTQNEVEGVSFSHPNLIIKEKFEDQNEKMVIISPLNTDIRFSDHLTKKNVKEMYDPRDYDHERTDYSQENFSWAKPTQYDSKLDLMKKNLIHNVSTQHACGSCWD